MFKLAVCDDEPLMRDEIAAALSGYMEKKGLVYRIDRFAGGQELLESREKFAMIFLDIQMEGLDGMETARRLRSGGYQGLLIFLTVLKDCVFDSFEVQAYDYWLKPLDPNRFCRTMDRAAALLSRGAADSLTIQKGTACLVVRFPQMIYCEVIGRKIYIHQQDGSVLDFYERLGNLEKRLDARFYRCHRSYLVNLDHVCGCQAGTVALSCGMQALVSRSRERGLTQALLLRMKERRC